MGLLVCELAVARTRYYDGFINSGRYHGGKTVLTRRWRRETVIFWDAAFCRSDRFGWKSASFAFPSWKRWFWKEYTRRTFFFPFGNALVLRFWKAHSLLPFSQLWGFGSAVTTTLFQIPRSVFWSSFHCNGWWRLWSLAFLWRISDSRLMKSMTSCSHGLNIIDVHSRLSHHRYISHDGWRFSFFITISCSTTFAQGMINGWRLNSGILALVVGNFVMIPIWGYCYLTV